MIIPENITKEHILSAIKKIDSEGVPSYARSSTYDLIYDGKPYPPKLVLSWANIFANGVELDRNSFEGGRNTDCFRLLEKEGFQIIEKKSLYLLISKFLNQAQTDSLKTKEYNIKYDELQIKASFGQGTAAEIPWMSFTAEGQTVSCGIYPVLLYFKSLDTLILSYGISEMNPPIKSWVLPENTKTIYQYFIETNKVSDPKELKKLRYLKSYVFKAYQNIDQSIKQDIDQIIMEYKNQLKRMDNVSINHDTNRDFNINQLAASLHDAGFHSEKWLIHRLAASLLTKPFVILTGLAGSGKTKIADLFSSYLSNDENEQVCLVPVGADWTNREALLGYPNALDPSEYILPENGALSLILEALKEENKQKPYFLILDEMNLSHVERYFADFLSAMESKKTISLHKSKHISNLPEAISLPPNLFIIGTVNIDETTYMFSPKVLDRANVIEFRVTSEGMNLFLANPKPIDMLAVKGAGSDMALSFLALSEGCSISNSNETLASDLLYFFNELKKCGAEFGFRSAAEIYKFVAIANELDKTWNKSEIIDAAIMQKLLPKLHGSRRKLSPILEALGTLCLNNGAKFNDPNMNSSDIKYPLSFDKIQRMYQALLDNGFTSYAEA